MQRFLCLVVATTILVLLAPARGVPLTFAVKAKEPANITPYPNVKLLALYVSHITESYTLAFLMLELGKKKYLPFEQRTEAVLHAGGGSGNTITGILGFFRLQQELIIMRVADKSIQPFTKVTIIFSRGEHQSDVTKIPEKAGEEIPSEKKEKVKRILAVLEQLMKSAGYEYLLIEEPLPSNDLKREEVDEDLQNQFEIIKGQLIPDKIVLAMDVLAGSGGRGREIAEKVRLNLMLLKHFADQNVPVFLHDGRSFDENNGLEEYNFKNEARVYSIHTTRARGKPLKPVQALIVTDHTKHEALNGWEIWENAQDVDGRTDILVGHGKVLTKNFEMFELAMQYPKAYLQKAFELIAVESNLYYKNEEEEKKEKERA